MNESQFTNALRPRPDELFTPGSQNHLAEIEEAEDEAERKSEHRDP